MRLESNTVRAVAWPCHRTPPGTGKNEGRRRYEHRPLRNTIFARSPRGGSQAHDRTPSPHVTRPRSVPPTKPPAPCTVTLPAHRPHAGTPAPTPIIMSVSRQTVSRSPARSMRPRPCLRASCPAEKSGAMRGGLEPRSSFACPRPATSPLRACPPSARLIRLRTAIGGRVRSARALPQAQPIAARVARPFPRSLARPALPRRRLAGRR